MHSAAVSICVLGLLLAARGDDPKAEVTLRGELTCGHCDLKKTDACQAVFVVKEGGREEFYYFPADFNARHGQDYCKERRDATVTGTVTEKDGKKVLTVKKIVVERKE